MISFKRGTYLLIRVDGTEELFEGKPRIEEQQRLIGCNTCDVVTLERTPYGEARTIMIVDDTGMVDHKPVNEKATAIARTVFGPGYRWTIHGNVIIADDRDFAP